MTAKINEKTYLNLVNAKITVYELKEFENLMRARIIEFIDSLCAADIVELLLNGEYSIQLNYENIAKFCKTWFLHIKIPTCFVYLDVNNGYHEMAWFVAGSDAVLVNSDYLTEQPQ